MIDCTTFMYNSFVIILSLVDLAAKHAAPTKNQSLYQKEMVESLQASRTSKI